jgi:outer membrane protein TolC
MPKTVFYPLLLLVLSLLFSPPAPVYAEAPSGPLTLRDCVGIALARNPSVRTAAALIQAAREGVGEAQAPYYPELGLQARYGRFQTHAFFPDWVRVPQGSSPVVGPTNDWLGGLRARYILYDFGEREARVRSARARQGVAEEEGLRVSQDIILAVHHGFFGLTSALEARKVADQNLERTLDHLRLTRERKEAGAVPKADVLRAQVEVSNAELALVRAENLIRLARGQLNLSLGRPVEQSTEISPGTPTVFSPDRIDLDLAFRQAAASRPEIKAAFQKIEHSKSKIQEAKSAYGPRVRAEGSYGWRDSDFLPQDEDWLVGVAIEWPLFTGFARQHRLAQARADLSREEAEAERLDQLVRQEVWNAHSRLRESYQALQTADVLVGDALESHRLTRERYEAGAGTITDLLDSQAALARAQASQVEAGWDYQVARAQFKRATGTLGPDE